LKNLFHFGYDYKKAPTLTIETGAHYKTMVGGEEVEIKLPHSVANDGQRIRRDSREYSLRWTSTNLQQELIFSALDAVDAGIALDVIEEQLKRNYKMIDKLKNDNLTMSEEELVPLKYNKKEIENALKEAYKEKHPQESEDMKKQSKGCE